MNHQSLRLIAFILVLSLTEGCAVMSMAKTSRYGFYPPISTLVTAAHEPGQAIARHASFAWQTVSQPLAPGMAVKEKAKVISVAAAPGLSHMVEQAQIRADNASEQRRIQANLAGTAKSRGDASYHHSLARLHAEDALVQTKMAVATGRIDSSIQLMQGTFGIYNSLAAAGKAQGNKDYGLITKNIATDMNLLGKDAPEGSTLHLEYQYGLEPSAAKKFKAGLGMFIGGNQEANNAFMVTAVLTQPGGKRITATRLVKMIWYAGQGNLNRPFPEGYEEFHPNKLPNPAGVQPFLVYYQVLNQLARATVEDLRKQVNRTR